MREFLEWFNDNYGLTLFIVFTLVTLFVVITVKVFFAPVDVPTGTAAAYATFFAMLGITIGLWKWKRSRKDKVEEDARDSE